MKVKLPKREQERLQRQVKKAEKKKLEEHKQDKQCIICQRKATHHIKGLPNDTYCKECAKEHFKYLNYLEQL